MAKMFYTVTEATKHLQCKEEDLKAYAREGRLREFRDGPRLMFKADQVERLRAETLNESLSASLDRLEQTVTAPYAARKADQGDLLDLRDDNNDPSSGLLSLLSLEKESDDTALGAVLDEIAPPKLTFRYEGMNSSGQEVKGEIEAVDSYAAIARIRALGIFPTKCREKTNVKPKEQKQTVHRHSVADVTQVAAAAVVARSPFFRIGFLLGRLFVLAIVFAAGWFACLFFNG